MIKNLLLAGAGGCLGTMLRFCMYQLFKPSDFPVATLVINIAGSLIIGAVIALSLKDAVFNNTWKTFLATGICGGFTTFSAFSIENLHLVQEGKFALSILYIAGSILLGILAAWAGYRLAL
jgi:CrcB protein